MLPDLRWHSLSPLTPKVSEAGNRISPQAKHWPGFFNDATINPWNAQPSKNSKATMPRLIVHIYFTHLVMFIGNYHSNDWNWGQWSTVSQTKPCLSPVSSLHFCVLNLFFGVAHDLYSRFIHVYFNSKICITHVISCNLWEEHIHSELLLLENGVTILHALHLCSPLLL